MANDTASEAVFASGSVSGSSLNLEVVPESAKELYAMALSRNQVKLSFLLAINCLIPDIIANVVA